MTDDPKELTGIVRAFISADRPGYALTAFLAAMFAKVVPAAIGAVAASAWHWLGGSR